MNKINENICRRCGSRELRPWRELAEEEKDVAKRLKQELLMSVELRNCRICSRCWHVTFDGPSVA